MQLEDLEQEIKTYHKHTTMSTHEQRNEDVRKIQEELKEVMEASRKFNKREELFGKDKTDYSKIAKMMKEFEPYLNLWTTVHGWYEGSERWVKGDWEKVDALEAQNFVDDGSRKLASVLRFFNDKDPIDYRH